MGRVVPGCRAGRPRLNGWCWSRISIFASWALPPACQSPRRCSSALRRHCGRRTSTRAKPGSVVRSTPQNRLGRALVVVQVTLSVLLLCGAALFVRTLHNLNGVAFGFDLDGILTMQVEATVPGRTVTPKTPAGISRRPCPARRDLARLHGAGAPGAGCVFRRRGGGYESAERLPSVGWRSPSTAPRPVQRRVAASASTRSPTATSKRPVSACSPADRSHPAIGRARCVSPFSTRPRHGRFSAWRVRSGGKSVSRDSASRIRSRSSASSPMRAIRTCERPTSQWPMCRWSRRSIRSPAPFFLCGAPAM